MTVPRRQSPHDRAWWDSNAARHFRPCVAVYSPGADTWEKNNKRALQCARCLTKLKTAGSMLTYAHIPSPHWRQRRKSHRDAVKITVKKLASVASIRLRCTVMAANRKTRHNNTVTSRQYGWRAIFVHGDVKFQDGDAFDLSKRGGGALSSTFTSFFLCFTYASLFRNKVHTKDYSCIMVRRPVRHSGSLYARFKSMCVAYNTD